MARRTTQQADDIVLGGDGFLHLLVGHPIARDASSCHVAHGGSRQVVSIRRNQLSSVVTEMVFLLTDQLNKFWHIKL